MKSLSIFCTVIVLAVFHFSGGISGTSGTSGSSGQKQIQNPFKPNNED
jgi:hypothetical protein